MGRTILISAIELKGRQKTAFLRMAGETSRTRTSLTRHVPRLILRTIGYVDGRFGMHAYAFDKFVWNEFGQLKALAPKRGARRDKPPGGANNPTRHRPLRGCPRGSLLLVGVVMARSQAIRRVLSYLNKATPPSPDLIGVESQLCGIRPLPYVQ